ncbi:MAG: hypothetical protein AABX89_02140 [Candidatus Thermoplasmatota archaeon]
MRALPVALGLVALLAALPTAAADPVAVTVDLHLISVGNYDTAKGTYTLDFYLHMRWDPQQAPANFTPEQFEFMNGRAASRELLSDETGPAGRDVWYRIQANLYNSPAFADYPFDAQRLTITLEDTINQADTLVFVPGSTTLDADARVAGWRQNNLTALATVKEYPFGESYSRLTYTLELRREPVSSALRTFLPPVAFMLVASFSFFFDRSQASNRLALGTGMLITAVGFHISQTVSLPPLGALTLFDKVMISAYSFIASTILVTTVLVFGEQMKLPQRIAELVNRRGAILAIALPVVVFLALHYL